VLDRAYAVHPAAKSVIPGVTRFRAHKYAVRSAGVVELAALKMSHIYHNIAWLKNISDLHRLLAVIRKDAALEAEWQSAAVVAFIAARRKETDERIGVVPAQRINLAQSNESFLAGTVLATPPTVEHDRLHELVAYGARPIFEQLKRDPSQAMIDKDLFLVRLHAPTELLLC